MNHVDPVIGAPMDVEPTPEQELNPRFIAILDQDAEWCAKDGTVPLAGMTGRYARNVVAFLQRRKVTLCFHYFSYRLRLTALDPDPSDGVAGEHERLQRNAERAATDPLAWLNGTTLMRRLLQLATYRCGCGGDVGPREPGDAAGLGCLEDITHNWHPYADHSFFSSHSGMVCGQMVRDADGFGTDCGLAASHPVHLEAASAAR